MGSLRDEGTVAPCQTRCANGEQPAVGTDFMGISANSISDMRFSGSRSCGGEERKGQRVKTCFENLL